MFELPRIDNAYQELLEQYGIEYLGEKDSDKMPLSMEYDFDEYLSTPYEAVRAAFYGFDWNPFIEMNRSGDNRGRESFNPNRDYFAFNGYGNIVSIDARDLVYYLYDEIDEDYFYSWCQEMGYID